MTSRNVIKTLAAMQDFSVGVGAFTQTRGGVSMTVNKVDIPFAVNTIAEMQALDVAKYHRARVYTTASNVTEYLYDPLDNTGISSDTGAGTWVLAPESSKVLSVEDRITLRLTEPMQDQQIAVALGGASLGVGFGGVYWHDTSDTTTADDGDNVFVTTGGARWKKVLFEANEIAQLQTAGGSANALTASFGLASIPQDRVFWLRVSSTNTDAMTLNIDALGVKDIKYMDGSAVIAGAVEANKVYAFIYDGTRFLIVNPSVSELAAEAGTDNFGYITALRLAQVLAPTLASVADLIIDIEDVLLGVYGEVLDAQVFTVSGSWTKPACSPDDTVVALMWSGAGSGAACRGGTVNSMMALGGSGGGCFLGYCRASTLGAVETVTVGIGGVPVVRSTNGRSGGMSGSPTIFGNITVLGGIGGTEPEDSSIPGYAVDPLYNTIMKPFGGGVGKEFGGSNTSVWGRTYCSPEFRGGQNVAAYDPSIPVTVSYAGHALYGGAAGGSSYEGSNMVSNPSGKAGGVSVFGGDGGTGDNQSATNNATGTAGTAPGGGGGGAHAVGTGTATSGAGARGEVRIYVIKGWHPHGFPMAI